MAEYNLYFKSLSVCI